MKIKSVQIGEFLKSLTDADYQFLKLTINVRDGIQSLINNYCMTKEDICYNFIIKEEDYEKFISGNYAYSISDIAAINSLFLKFQQEKLANKVPFQVATTENQ